MSKLPYAHIARLGSRYYHKLKLKRLSNPLQPRNMDKLYKRMHKHYEEAEVRLFDSSVVRPKYTLSIYKVRVSDHDDEIRFFHVLNGLYRQITFKIKDIIDIGVEVDGSDLYDPDVGLSHFEYLVDLIIVEHEKAPPIDRLMQLRFTMNKDILVPLLSDLIDRPNAKREMIKIIT